MLEALPPELVCLIVVFISPEDLLQMLSVSEHVRGVIMNTLPAQNVRTAVALIAIKRCTSLWDSVDLIRKAIRANMNVAVYWPLSLMCNREEALDLTVQKPSHVPSPRCDHVYKVTCYTGTYANKLRCAETRRNPFSNQDEPKEVRDPINKLVLHGWQPLHGTEVSRYPQEVGFFMPPPTPSSPEAMLEVMCTVYIAIGGS